MLEIKKYVPLLAVLLISSEMGFARRVQASSAPFRIFLSSVPKTATISRVELPHVPEILQSKSANMRVLIGCANADNLRVTIGAEVSNLSDQEVGVWSVLRSEHNQMMVYHYTPNPGEASVYFENTFPPTTAIRGETFTLQGDNTIYRAETYVASYTSGMPLLTQLRDSVTFRRNCGI